MSNFFPHLNLILSNQMWFVRHRRCQLSGPLHTVYFREHAKHTADNCFLQEGLGLSNLLWTSKRKKDKSFCSCLLPVSLWNPCLDVWLAKPSSLHQWGKLYWPAVKDSNAEHPETASLHSNISCLLCWWLSASNCSTPPQANHSLCHDMSASRRSPFLACPPSTPYLSAF